MSTLYARLRTFIDKNAKIEHDKDMTGTERIFYILEKLKTNKMIQVKDLAKDLDLSEATIRRDLNDLEAQGQLKRIHGGAILESSHSILSEQKEVLMQDRFLINYDSKIKVAKEAAKTVQDGECIFLDGGTSLVPLMEVLQDRPIRIVTHNHLLISKLHQPKAQVVVIGGDYISKYAMSAGAMAQEQLRQFQFDRAFIGCAGIDLEENMSYTAEMETRQLKRIAMHNSRHNYLLIDESKCDTKGFCTFASLDAFEHVYCGHIAKEEVYPNQFIFV